jgi:tRNA (mo5U34)-methyltransferase
MLDISQLLSDAEAFISGHDELKLRLAPPENWYPYGSINNLWHLDRLLTGQHRDLDVLGAGEPIADIGGADGDIAFFLARHGMTVDIVDWGPANWNGLRGARLLADHVATTVTVHEVDLDSQFDLPRERYGLVLFLGILYHLRNPYYALQHLAERSRYALVSTRIARVTADGVVRLDDAPVAYLVHPTETNNDSTNYWIFSLSGLHRIFDRTGWDVVEEITAGRTDGDSDPSSADRDERAYFLLRSRLR